LNLVVQAEVGLTGFQDQRHGKGILSAMYNVHMRSLPCRFSQPGNQSPAPSRGTAIWRGSARTTPDTQFPSKLIASFKCRHQI